MNLDRDRVKREFATYTNNYDPSDPKIKLKIIHTYKVADIAEKIAVSENLSPEECDIAFLLGMLHDIGRFEQIRRFHTFKDSISVDHAALSADILFKDGLIKKFVDEPYEADLIEKAIRVHNVYALPKKLTVRELLFANILRDADKLDILRVNIESPIPDIFDVSEEELKSQPITDEVYREFLSHSNINRAIVKTRMDSYITKIAFVFGLVFKASYKELLREGYLMQLLEFKSNNPQTSEQFEKIRNETIDYVNLHL
ncbi:MAG: HD domain-containing protein [Lachnospiraceae bacterium]|nr:HD domain-containing protein [Lachnospiraceae bacterium]